MINGVGNVLQNILKNGAEGLKEAIGDIKDRMRNPAYWHSKIDCPMSGYIWLDMVI